MNSPLKLFLPVLVILIISSKIEGDCFDGLRTCGSEICYDPQLQNCDNTTNTVTCMRDCNGTCYANSSRCHYDLKICDQNQAVCNVSKPSLTYWIEPELVCYNSSSSVCLNGALCDRYYICGGECLKYETACVNNQTLCPGFYYWNQNVRLCGQQQTCYDNTTHFCYNGRAVCSIARHEICGNTCIDPDKQICINGTTRCLHSCNGTCYSNDSYCAGDGLACLKNESVCNVTRSVWWPIIASGPTCYNPSWFSCLDNTICYNGMTCGSKCPEYFNHTCVDNRTICPGFYYWKRNVNLCGREKICYDNTTHACLEDSGIVCPIGYGVCGGTCFNSFWEQCCNGVPMLINFSEDGEYVCIENTNSTTVVVQTTATSSVRGNITETSTRTSTIISSSNGKNIISLIVMTMSFIISNTIILH